MQTELMYSHDNQKMKKKKKKTVKINRYLGIFDYFSTLDCRGQALT